MNYFLLLYSILFFLCCFHLDASKIKQLMLYDQEMIKLEQYYIEEEILRREQQVCDEEVARITRACSYYRFFRNKPVKVLYKTGCANRAFNTEVNDLPDMIDFADASSRKHRMIAVRKVRQNLKKG